MITADEINELVDNCIDHLCDDNADYGAESLVELANIWAKSGLGKSSFMNMRQYIINSSIDRLGTNATSFIEYKLENAEKKLSNQRRATNGNSNIIIH